MAFKCTHLAKSLLVDAPLQSNGCSDSCDSAVTAGAILKFSSDIGCFIETSHSSVHKGAFMSGQQIHDCKISKRSLLTLSRRQM